MKSRNAYRILVVKLSGFMRGWEDNIKMNVREIDYEDGK
jgi:hypothetical protein